MSNDCVLVQGFFCVKMGKVFGGSLKIEKSSCSTPKAILS